MKIYLVINEWADGDNNGADALAFDSLEKAQTEMKVQIEQEINEKMSQCFEDGKPSDGYCVDEGANFWEFWEDGYYYYCHTLIKIIELEVM